MIDTDASETPIVNVAFPAQGRRLPADHGYALYAAIARCAPRLHKAPWLSVELISGIPWGNGTILLPTHGSRLHLRIPAKRYAEIFQLAGKRLEIDGYTIRLGTPSARPLQPASSLYARMVTIKKFMEAEPFLDAARRQIEALGISASLELPLDEDERFRRRIVRIHDKAVVGFSVVAHGLSDVHSIVLQSRGIGGRRAMGCGAFVPIVGRAATVAKELK